MENNKKMQMQKKMMDMCANMSMEQCQSMMQNMMKKEPDFGSLQMEQNQKITGTPELQNLFLEWCEQIKKEMTNYSKESGNTNLEAISDHFKLSQESCDYILNKL